MARNARLDYQTQKVDVGGHNVVCYSYGSGDNVLLCANGGPGLPCDYLRDSHGIFARHGYRVVIHDQLGTGESDKPADDSLWTIDRYVEELEAVRNALGLDKVNLLGHSWGTWLAIEYILAYPKRVKTFICANGSGEVPLQLLELQRLRCSLGRETVEMMNGREASGTTDHPEYQAAVTILNYRHVCRLNAWPESLERSLTRQNKRIYETMWGPNEFTCTGRLQNWDQLEAIHQISQPSLVLCGRHDEITPQSANRLVSRLPQSELKIFENSSHMPFYEEPDLYQSTLLDFLQRNS